MCKPETHKTTAITLIQGNMQEGLQKTVIVFHQKNYLNFYITMPQHLPHLRKLQRMCMSTMDTRVSARLDSRCLSLLCRPLRIRRVFLKHSIITLILVFWDISRNFISIRIEWPSFRKLATLGKGHRLFKLFRNLFFFCQNTILFRPELNSEMWFTLNDRYIYDIQLYKEVLFLVLFKQE